jgi:mRNA interferase RelE/StbE
MRYSWQGQSPTPAPPRDSAPNWTQKFARIDAKLESYATPGKGDVKRLAGRDGTRLRVGDWRVISYEEDGMIVVAAVGHRREIYD